MKYPEIIDALIVAKSSQVHTIFHLQRHRKPVDRDANEKYLLKTISGWKIWRIRLHLPSRISVVFSRFLYFPWRRCFSPFPFFFKKYFDTKGILILCVQWLQDDSWHNLAQIEEKVHFHRRNTYPMSGIVNMKWIRRRIVCV